MTDLFSKIQEVTSLKGLAGHEGQVRDYLRQAIAPNVDRIETDGLGGLFGIKEDISDLFFIVGKNHGDATSFFLF